MQKFKSSSNHKSFIDIFTMITQYIESELELACNIIFNNDYTCRLIDNYEIEKKLEVKNKLDKEVLKFIKIRSRMMMYRTKCISRIS